MNEQLNLNGIQAAIKESILKRPQTEQAYLYFGAPFEMKEGDPEFYKARVAMFILGSSGFGSRLMEEIRVKRGLAYSAYSRLSVAKTNSYFSGFKIIGRLQVKPVLRCLAKSLAEDQSHFSGNRHSLQGG